jgi:hypothetical protein
MSESTRSASLDLFVLHLIRLGGSGTRQSWNTDTCSDDCGYQTVRIANADSGDPRLHQPEETHQHFFLGSMTVMTDRTTAPAARPRINGGALPTPCPCVAISKANVATTEATMVARAAAPDTRRV